MEIVHPTLATVCLLAWCLICCASAWWYGAKAGRRWVIKETEKFVRDRDIEWAKLLACRLEQRNRDWVALLVEAKRSGRQLTPEEWPGRTPERVPYR